MRTWESILLGILLIAGNLFTPLPFHFAQSKPPQVELLLYLPVIPRDVDPSWSWRDVEKLTLSPTPNDEPFLVSDQSGRIHIFWDVWPSSDAFIYHTYQTGTGWSVPEKIANTLGTSRMETQPLITPDGLMHILWYNELSFGGPYRLMYASYDGARWSAEEEVARFSNPNRYGFLNYDEQGHVHLVYLDDDIFRAHYLHRQRDATGWSTAVDITPETGNKLISWNVGPDRTGGVVFVGWDFSQALYYSYWKDGNFEKTAEPLANARWSESSIVDGHNNVHLYETGDVPIPGGNVTGLYHQCLNTNLEWGPEQVLSEQGSIGTDVAAAWDDSGQVIFGWKAFRDKSINLSILDGCSQSISKKYQLPEPEQYSDWGSIEAITLSSQPRKFCALIGVLYQSQQFGLACADIH